MVEVPVKIIVTNSLKKAKEASRAMALLRTTQKNDVLLSVAKRIMEQEESILEANEQDVNNVGRTFEGEGNRERVKEAVDRVRLRPEDVKAMVESLHRVAELPDPVGDIPEMEQRPNGMQVSRVRAPIGVIAIISEFGPLTMVESVALCVKSGNVCVYRCGAEWTQTNAVLGAVWSRAADEGGVPRGGLTFIDRPDKEAAVELFRQPKYVDAVIPKGGAGLRKAVVEQSRVPVLCHDGGVNTIYIDSDTDLPLAQNIVVNSKVQDAQAANSVDTLLIHQETARNLVPALIRRVLDEFKVEVRGCPKTNSLIGSQSFTSYKTVKEATEEDWSRQFLSPNLAVKIVASLDEALDHLARYAPVYTAAVVTRDYETAMRFTREVEAAAVLVNASTRLHDAEPFGLGRQVGVNTGRLHARGPISLEHLTCEKYVVLGTGQLRHPHPVPITYEDAIMLKRPS